MKANYIVTLSYSSSTIFLVYVLGIRFQVHWALRFRLHWSTAMISAPHQLHYTSTMSRRPTSNEHRASPTPSEQSFQTTVTNPVSLFSVSQADGISDSISLVTTGHDALIWGRHPRTAMPIGYTMVRVQSSAPGHSHSQQQQSDLDLFEFLKEAQLEHYYTALTTHLKVTVNPSKVGHLLHT